MDSIRHTSEDNRLFRRFTSLLDCHILAETMCRSPLEGINCARNQERDRPSDPRHIQVTVCCNAQKERMWLEFAPRDDRKHRTDGAGGHHPLEFHRRPPRQPAEEQRHQGNGDVIHD